MAIVSLDRPRSLLEYVGKELAVTDWFAVTQEKIDQFATTTDDTQWIHMDQERARAESPFGTTVAHGFFTLSLLTHFLDGALLIRGGYSMVVNYGLNRVRFPAPVNSGAGIRGRFRVLAVKELGKAVEVIFEVTVEGEAGSKPHCVAEWVLRYYD